MTLDDRILEIAMGQEHDYIADKVAAGRKSRTWTVLVLGSDPFPIEASSSGERAQKMSDRGIDLVKDEWAAGCRDDNLQLQLCGPSTAARAELKELMKR